MKYKKDKNDFYSFRITNKDREMIYELRQHISIPKILRKAIRDNYETIKSIINEKK